MKNLVTSLLLFLVVAAVGGWIYFNERGPVAETGSAVLLRTQTEKVRSFVLEPDAGERLEFARRKGGWQVHRVGTNSVAVPADEERVEELLESLQLLQSGAVVEGAEAEKLKEYGIDRPIGAILLEDAKIEFGNRPYFDPSQIYTRVTNRGAVQIALLPARLSEFLDEPFDVWRDKSALRVAAEDVTELRIQAPAVKAGFKRVFQTDPGELDLWEVTEPVQGRADAEMIQSLLQQFTLSKTPRFLEDNPKNLAKWGLEKPVTTVEVTTNEGKSTLRIGKEVEGGRAAQNSISNVVFTVTDSILGPLAEPLSGWRDRKLVRFSIEDVQRMQVSARGQKTNLLREGELWKRETSGKTSASASSVAASAVTDISLGLQKLEAEEFIDTPQPESTYGLEKPVLEVELFSNVWRTPKEIRLSLKDGKVYARVTEEKKDSPVYRLDSQALESFKLSLDALFPSKKG